MIPIIGESKSENVGMECGEGTRWWMKERDEGTGERDDDAGTHVRSNFLSAVSV